MTDEFEVVGAVISASTSVLLEDITVLLPGLLLVLLLLLALDEKDDEVDVDSGIDTEIARTVFSIGDRIFCAFFARSA